VVLHVRACLPALSVAQSPLTAHVIPVKFKDGVAAKVGDWCHRGEDVCAARGESAGEAETVRVVKERVCVCVSETKSEREMHGKDGACALVA